MGGLEDKDVIAKLLREAGSLLLVAKMAYSIDEDDAVLLARRLRWLRDETEERVEQPKLAA